MHRKRLPRKVFTVGIVILFIGIGMASSTARYEPSGQKNGRGHILYVGGFGAGNYTHIQDAIDNASDGDTVFVFSGVYDEHVNVDKSITLLGENQTTTVIDGQGNGGSTVRILAAGVTLSGFTLQDCGDISNAAELYISSDNNQITGNTMDCFTKPHGEEAIWCWNSSGNNIERNSIQNHYCGIWLEYCSNSTLSHNTIMNIGELGIVIGNTKDVTISGNTITKSTIGIYLRDSNNNTISENTVTKNTEGGVEVMEMDAISAGNAIVNNNIFSNGGRDGLFILAKQSHSKNLWDQNYWGRPFLFPKLIIGRKAVLTIPGIPFHFPGMTLMMPWFTADWHPVKTPYLS